MGSIYRKNDKWYVRFKDGHGRWRDTSTQATTKTEAKSLLHDLEVQADRQRRGLEPLPEHRKQATFGEALDAWKAEVGSRLRSTTIIGFGEKHLRDELGPLPLKDVTPSRLEVLLNVKIGELSPESLNHLRALLHRIFELALRRGLSSGLNPAKAVPRFKKPKKLPQYLKAEEVPLMLAALERRWRPLFATAVYTGMRKGELLALCKSDVDLTAGTVVVARSHASDTTKGGHADLLPIAEGLVPFLREALATSTSELLFPAEDGSQRAPDSALHKVLRRALGRAGLVEGYNHVCRRKGCGYAVKKSHAVPEPCPRCGMKLWPKPLPRPLRFHDLRHTTATLLLKVGVPLATVQRILRHSDPAITSEIYGHLDVEDMRKGLNLLAFGPAVSGPVEALLAAGASPAPLAASLLLESRSPKGEGPGGPRETRESPGPSMVGATGFEPATTCTPSKCATRLRYAPIRLLLPPS
jgi:integrase